MQPNCASVQGGFSLSNPFSTFPSYHVRSCSSLGVLVVLENNLPRAQGSKLREVTTSCCRQEFINRKEQKLCFDLQVQYNPGTGFLTDDSGVVLRYHRKADLRLVGRLLVTSALGQTTEVGQSTKVGQTSEIGQTSKTSVSSSTLCPSSCLSSQVENTSNDLTHVDVSNVLLQVSLVNVTSIFLWGGPSTDAVKVWANANHRLHHQH